MPKITLKPDNLNERNAEFTQVPLKQPVFLNSVPKSGSHLLRNIMRMFVPVNQHFKAGFIQLQSMAQDHVAWDKDRPTLSWGHLLFSDNSAIFLKDTRKVLLVRDPYDWVLARARFFMSDSFQGSLEHLKGGNVTVDEVLNMMIFGIHGKAPTLYEIFTHNAVSWLGTKIRLLRMEDLIVHVNNLDTLEAETFFARLMHDCAIGDLPDDWRERVRVGADREQSGTARENLAGGGFEIPHELPDTQKQLVNYVAPGLRQVLGYE